MNKILFFHVCVAQVLWLDFTCGSALIFTILLKSDKPIYYKLCDVFCSNQAQGVFISKDWMTKKVIELDCYLRKFEM